MCYQLSSCKRACAYVHMSMVREMLLAFATQTDSCSSMLFPSFSLSLAATSKWDVSHVTLVAVVVNSPDQSVSSIPKGRLPSIIKFWRSRYVMHCGSRCSGNLLWCNCEPLLQLVDPNGVAFHTMFPIGLENVYVFSFQMSAKKSAYP